MSSRVADFHRLRARLKLAGTLTTRTALRIGSGGTGVADAVDLPVLKDADGFPLIPGASLKGALRTTIEALVRGAEQRERGLWTCDPLAEPGENRDPDRIPACGGHGRGARADATARIEDSCAVCRLFGSFLLASHVRFSDAMLQISAEDRRRGRVPLEIRDGVSIDRDLRRAAGKRKFDFEVVSPGADFAIEVFVENPESWLLGLLAMGFDQVAEGFTALGGFTSRGLGRVDLSWHTLTRFTAEELLTGQPATVHTGEALAAEMQVWRDALARKHRGVE
jgi:CRISPR-associated protein Csm3